MNVFADFDARIKKALQDIHLISENGDNFDLSRITVESPRDPSYGDIATNVAMVLSKAIGEDPRSLAMRITDLLKTDFDIESVNVAGPGFINLRLKKRYWHHQMLTMLTQASHYGRSTLGAGHKVNIEYVSANPTGPMHVGHCRGAVVGDVLANLLAFTGFDVTREYYINDAGGQVNILAQSVLLRYREILGDKNSKIPSGLYPGDYLIPVAQTLAKDYEERLLQMAEEEALKIVKTYAIEAMMTIIKADLNMLNVHHDIFFSERSLHAENAAAIHSAINDLVLKGYVYKGKLPPPKRQLLEEWEDREQTLFRSTDVGDDIDRSLMKSDGAFTYFAADVAYFKNKYDRGFTEMIYILGADHGGYVKRLEAVARAVSDGKVKLSVLLCQLVRLFRNGKPVRMSKRAGEFVTLREVVEEVGCDPVRFMMLYRKNDAPLDFDFAKVTEHSKDNPVFYVQYASARCHSVFRQAKEQLGLQTLDRSAMIRNLEKLTDDSEITLIRKLSEYPRVIEAATIHREPHRLAFYLYELASVFHGQWNRGTENPNLRFIKVNDPDVSFARLGLVQVVSDILTSALSIIGADAPMEMH